MILVDGEPAHAVPADDRAVAYGDGLFETLAVSAGRALALDRHLERLAQDAARLGLAAPPAAALRADVERLTATASQAVVKIIVTRGSGGRGYRPPSSAAPRRIVSLHPWPATLPADADAGVDLWLCSQPLSDNPALAGIKHLNRLDQVMASRAWPAHDPFEGLMPDTRGRLLEGTRSNLFFVTDGGLATPRLATCGIHGIVRGAVIEHQRAQGQALLWQDPTADDLARAHEVFVTNSIIGIRSVQRIHDLAHSDYDTAVARGLRDALRAGGIIP